MKTHALEIGLAGLVLLTLAAWLTGHNVNASWVIGCVLAATFIKKQWLIDEFMELRHAPAWMRWGVSGWLVLSVESPALCQYLIRLVAFSTCQHETTLVPPTR